ncbi:hypothetical protein [Leuconostoc citreum]|uniref:hypothetical protein n=1 Tax=Leuconostoc citreum TaxID=33964 RepID=UPI0032DEA903
MGNKEYKETTVFNVYFDEAYKDHSLKFKNENRNYHIDSIREYTIGTFVGWPEDEESTIEIDFTNWKNKWNDIYHRDKDREIKGEFFTQKAGLSNGFSTQKKFLDKRDMLYEFFQLVNKNIDFIQISFESKTFQAIREYIYPTLNLLADKQSQDNFLYGMCKFLDQHAPNDLWEHIIKQNVDQKVVYGEIYRALKSHKEQPMLNKFRRVKRTEKNFCIQAMKIIGTYNQQEFFQQKNNNKHEDFSLQFDYDNFFYGVCLHLKNNQIKKSTVRMLVDPEGTGREVDSAKKYFEVVNPKSIEHIESNSFVGLQISDIIAHTFGAISVYARKSIQPINSEGKKLISKSWFDTNQKGFDLYIEIFKLFEKNSFSSENDKGFYFTYISKYADDAFLCINMIKYYGRFNSFEEFSEETPEQHTEYFNSSIVDSLDRKVFNNK